jgi:hypothetical protein
METWRLNQCLKRSLKPDPRTPWLLWDRAWVGSYPMFATCLNLSQLEYANLAFQGVKNTSEPYKE